jgi:hypothetical protein
MATPLDDARRFLKPLPTHRDNGADRALGKRWEEHFCRLARDYGKSFTPQQIGRSEAAPWFAPSGTPSMNRYLLPDVTIWTAPGEHHEIKHKEPTPSGDVGLEVYRYEALLAFRFETAQPVLYTIHNWRHAGASTSRDAMPNRVEDWFTVDIEDLAAYVARRQPEPCPFPTYVNGQWERRPGYYWPVTLWSPLASWWDRAPF